MRTSRRTLAALLFAWVSAAPGADPPRKAPDFSINLPGGKTLPISQYKGHVVVLAFIETFCTSCQAAVGVLTKLQNDYGPRGLQVLATAVNSDAPQAMPLFLKNFSPSFPIGLNDRNSPAAFIPATGKLQFFPMLALIDREGNVRGQHERGDEAFFQNLDQNLRKEIEALLKPAAPSRKTAR